MSLASRIRALLWVTPQQFSTSARKTRQVIRICAEQLGEQMTEGFDRLNASFEGLSGDIAGLKASAATLSEQVATLTEGQDAAVAAGVEAALADFNSQLDAVAGKFEGLDAETPAAPVDPPVDPAV